MTGTPAVPQRLARYATVPSRLLAVCVVTAGGALLLWYVITSGVHHARQGVRTIGQDAAPSIFAAQQIRARLADLHAEAANDLLAGGLGSTTARQAYTADLEHVATALVTVARNLTYPEEFQPIVEMQQQLVVYTGLIEEARTEIRHGNPVGVAFLRRSDNIMSTKLMPAAQRLDDVNQRHLEAQYTTRTGQAWRTIAIVLLLGLALGLGLGWQQRYVRRIFRRRYNLGLLSASGLTLCLAAYTAWALGTSQMHLRTAKQDTFDSVYALLRLHAEANQANAAESLWLLAPGAGQSYVQRFQESAQHILDPAVTTALVEGGWKASEGQQLRADGQTTTAHTLVARRLAEEAITRKKTVTGFLGNALANITLPGEGTSATEILVWYVHYMALDSLIRTSESEGRHWDAVELCVGTKPGQSNWAFQHLDKAISRTLALNMRGFDTAVAQASGVFRGLDMAAPALLLLVVLCTVWGLWPRIAEFR